MKKLLFIFFCLLALLPSTISYAAEIKIDGDQVKFPDAKPFIKDNRTLVPIRFIAESVGAQVDWDGSTGIVTIQKDSKLIILKNGENQATVDGIVKNLDTGVLIKENRCFVPLRFVLEEIGLNVYWNHNNASIDLITNSIAENHVTGLLFGLKKTDGNNCDYRTLWITQDKGNANYIEKKSAIIMPYKESFLKIINNKYYKETKYPLDPLEHKDILSVNYVISLPSEANESKIDPVGLSNGNMLFNPADFRLGDHYTNSSNVLYAGNTFCCINESCKRTDRQTGEWSIYSNKTYNSNSIIDKRKTLNLLALMGSKTKQIIDDYCKQYNKEVETSSWTYKQAISPDDICLVRNKGKWNLALPVLWEMIQNPCENYFINEYVTLEDEIPSEFNQYNELGIQWDTIKAAVPKAVDAVTSPSNDVLLVQTDNELEIFLNPLQGIKDPFKTIPCSSNEKIVLNQWVTGKSEVSKWDDNFRK